MGYEEFKIEGRNPVMEAFRSGRTVDKLFVLDGCEDGPVKSIIRAAKNRIRIFSLSKKNVWISCLRHISIRVLSRWQLLTVTVQWRIF